MVLGSDETAICAHPPYRLIVAAVTIFQLVGVGSRRFGEELVAHADTEHRLLLLHRLTDMIYGDPAIIGITGSVRDKKTIIIDMTEIVVPGDRKSTRLNSSHVKISYAVFCL